MSNNVENNNNHPNNLETIFLPDYKFFLYRLIPPFANLYENYEYMDNSLFAHIVYEYGFDYHQWCDIYQVIYKTKEGIDKINNERVCNNQKPYISKEVVGTDIIVLKSKFNGDEETEIEQKRNPETGRRVGAFLYRKKRDGGGSIIDQHYVLGGGFSFA